MIEFEIDGKTVQAREGTSIIEAADAAGIDIRHIPRFCYHQKLSIAASCRMCLVEVENAAKPLPACATQAQSGMKVYTRSVKTLAAQRDVMTFLLANHPLDCPICDQGGECELQDLSVGYGRGVSSFTEGKRVVKDKDIGPLIATEMTRCIHCTRCVRFEREIAGTHDIGMIGRGEHSEISPYVEQALTSELAGNMIDLCPVGALTSKPFRFKTRPWKLVSRPSISPHEGVGSHLDVHVKPETDHTPEQIMRVVPRMAEAINEMWISDRDRFSYTGLYHPDRLTQPMIRRDGRWQATDWETALRVASQGLQRVIDQYGAKEVGGLITPNATIEEAYLFQRWLRGLGVTHIDHRIRQLDFSHQMHVPLLPQLGLPIQALEQVQSFLLVGSFIREEEPLIAHRIRKATRKGARVHVMNPVLWDMHFDTAETCIVSPWRLLHRLAAMVRVLAEKDKKPLETVPAVLRDWIQAQTPDDTVRAIARDLLASDVSAIVLGRLLVSHPHLAWVDALAQLIATYTGATLGQISYGCNAAGVTLAGALPHRGLGGGALPSEKTGDHAEKMLREPKKAYCLFGIEPEDDSAYPQRAQAALQQAECVVACSAFKHPAMLAVADVLLPIACHLENEGTFVNLEGTWQSFQRTVARPFGEARCGWNVLRMLAHFMGVSGFRFDSVTAVFESFHAAYRTVKENGTGSTACGVAPLTPLPAVEEGVIWRCGYWPIYREDDLVRRAEPLQQSALQKTCLPLRLHPDCAKRLQVKAGDYMLCKGVDQTREALRLSVVIDARVAAHTVVLPSGLAGLAIDGPLSMLTINT